MRGSSCEYVLCSWCGLCSCCFFSARKEKHTWRTCHFDVRIHGHERILALQVMLAEMSMHSVQPLHHFDPPPTGFMRNKLLRSCLQKRSVIALPSSTFYRHHSNHHSHKKLTSLPDPHDNYNWWVMGRDILGAWKPNPTDAVHGFEMRWVCGSSTVADPSVVAVHHRHQEVGWIPSTLHVDDLGSISHICELQLSVGFILSAQCREFVVAVHGPSQGHVLFNLILCHW